MGRPAALTALAAAALLAPATALAEEPVPGAGGHDDVREIAARITRALKANEESLVRLARGASGDPKAVDLRLPDAASRACKSCGSGANLPEGGSCPSCGRGGATPGGGGAAPPAGGSAAEGMKELLQSLGGQGQSIVAGIDDLLARARSSSGGGGGDGNPSDRSRPGSDDGKGKDEEQKRREQEGRQEPKPDGKDAGKEGKEPKDGEDHREPKNPEARPPRSAKDPPSEEDLKNAFFARLPAKVREAVDNGDFDKVPEKYRALVAEWTRILAERDQEDARKGN